MSLVKLQVKVNQQQGKETDGQRRQRWCQDQQVMSLKRNDQIHNRSRARPTSILKQLSDITTRSFILQIPSKTKIKYHQHVININQVSLLKQTTEQHQNPYAQTIISPGSYTCIGSKINMKITGTTVAATYHGHYNKLCSES